MDTNNNLEFTSGFNDLKQVEMSLAAAKKMVGSATMSMDEGQLADATQAVQDAGTQLTNATTHTTEVDNEFLSNAEMSLSQCEEQLSEAKQK